MSDFTKLSDEELIALLKLHQIAAFREIYDRYWRKLYAEAYKRLKSREQTEELLQDLFTNLWVKREELNIRNSLGGYLYMSVSHYVIDHFRKEMVRAKYRSSFQVVYNELDTTTEDEIMLKDLTETLEAEINQLPDKCRSVYELSRKEHKSNKEIAVFLGISEKTVENHLTRALKQLRTGLSHYVILITLLLLR